MHDHASWSLSLGRWGNVPVRLHMVFLLFAAATFYLSWREEQISGSGSLDWIVAQSLGVLLLSVALHEVGHVIAAWRLGGSVRSVVLGPLGGLTSVCGIADHRSELAAHLAGPAVNFLLCLFCAPVLLAYSGNLVGLLIPLAPEGLTETNDRFFLVPMKLCFWINWTLGLVNLLPVFPFDGGRALRSAIQMKWPQAGRMAASQFVASVAKFVAVSIFITAFLLHFDDLNSLIPTRFALILLSIFLFFSAQHEERRSAAADEDRLLDSGPVPDLPGLERELARNSEDASGPLRRWLDRRREIREQRQSEIEAYEEQRVDEILARLHQHGMDALSPEDRAVLQRVSERLRSRQGP
jgi:Zn-dependent protease